MRAVCSRCGKDVSKAVFSHSKAKYGRPLCLDCQVIMNDGRTFKDRYRIVNKLID